MTRSNPTRGRVQYHKARRRDGDVGESVAIESVVAHLAREINEPELAFHEICSDYVHIDVHVIPPDRAHRFYTLVTSGMSDKAMRVPKHAAKFAFGELMLCLSPEWHFEKYQITDETTWPVSWLQHLARFPHKYGTWFSWGHSVPNGDPPKRLADGTQLCGSVFLEPKLFGQSFHRLKRSDGSTVWFWSVVPLYEEEMQYKVLHGTEALEKLLDEHGVTELLNPTRPRIVQK